MPRQELHSDTLPIEQMPPIADTSTYDGDIVLVDPSLASSDYQSELAFMENPVTIRLEPSSDKNAAMAFPVWVNGKGAEILINGVWRECAYLPVGQAVTTKRKYLEVVIRAKTDTIHTRVQEMDSERPNNVIARFTSPVHSFSIISDSNPRGAAWVQELRRRNL